MNRYLVYLLLALLALFSLRVLGNFFNCLIDHRSGYLILQDRAPIHAACKLRLNPFFL